MTKLTKIDTNEAKQYMTVEEYEKALNMIAEMKKANDSGKIDLTWEAERVLDFACGSKRYELLKASAKLCKNTNREYSQYNWGEGYADIAISVLGFDSVYGAITAEMTLTDVWSLGPDEANEAARTRLYVRTFTDQFCLR